MRFASRVDGLGGPGSEAWAIHIDAVRRVERGDDVILLSVGDPDFATPPSITAVAAASLERGRTHYTEVVGQEALRAAIASWHERTTGQTVTAAQVVVLAGAQCALFAALQCVVDPGDEVVVFEPMYLTYAAAVAASGGVPVPVPLRAENGFHLDPADLEAALGPRTRAVLWNGPNNPTGAVGQAAEIAALARACRERDLWLVSDEVYAGLVFEGQHRSPAAAPGMAERTIVVSSLSKSHAMTGWRVGWLVGPQGLAAHAGQLALCMLYGSPPFIQDAATVALIDAPAEISLMREHYRRRRDVVCDGLASVPGLRCHRPEAGMFVMLDVRDTGLGADAFARGLLEVAGVSVLAGDAFGGAATGHVRVALTVDEERLREACDRIGHFVAHRTRRDPLSPAGNARKRRA